MILSEKLRLAADPTTSFSVLEEFINEQIQGEAGDLNEAYALREAVASNSACPEGLLLILSRDEEEWVRAEVARNPSIPLTLLHEMACDQDSYIRSMVASNSSCSIELLERLAKDKDESVREAVAGNASCPVSLLKKWAKIKNEGMRASVGSNPSCPLELLDQLSRDIEPCVRESVAENPVLSEDLRKILSEDEDECVRRGVAIASRTPLSLLHQLSKDPSQYVRDAVGMNSTFNLGINRMNKSESSVLPKTSFPDLEATRDLTQPISDLREILNQAKQVHPKHPWLADPGFEDLDYALPAWSLITTSVPTSSADRCRSMFSGPFYCSDDFQWPTAEKGKFAAPVVQIDLREISTLRCASYGDGLLQVFILDDSGSDLCRVIPRDAIANGEISPVPILGVEEVVGNFAPTDWIERGGLVRQITGYANPELSSCIYVEAPEQDDPVVFHDIYRRLSQFEDVNTSAIHIFGTFYAIQYRHSQIGAELFMALDEELGYQWKDAGNAQIFCHRQGDGTLDFSLMWSCY